MSRKRSSIWKYFAEVKDSKIKAKCKCCSQVFSFCGGSTGNLARHLRKRHHEIYSLNQRNELKSKMKRRSCNAEKENRNRSGEMILIEAIHDFEVNEDADMITNSTVVEEIVNGSNHYEGAHEHMVTDSNPDEVLASGSNDCDEVALISVAHDYEVQENSNLITNVDVEQICDELTVHVDSLEHHTPKCQSKRSLIWNHFAEVQGTGRKAKCRYCFQLISFAGGSHSNLSRHLKSKHQISCFSNDDTLKRTVAQEFIPEEVFVNLDDDSEITVIQESDNDRRYFRLIPLMTSGYHDTHGDEGKKCPQNTTSEDKILLQPFNYIEQVPGKQIRTKLTKAFNHWLNIPTEKCKAIGDIIQMMHNASLLIDDIEDNSKMRRGVPVAHNIFGVASTINSANYVYFLGLEKTLKLDHPKATAVFTQQLLELHRGQGMEIYWRDNFICPTVEEYKIMVKKKTGGLFGLGVQLMQLFSENQSDFSKIIGLVGLFFQIRDDYANLKSKKYTENKSYCEDLTEGKFSFPIIHSIKNYPDDPTIMNIIRQRTMDVEIKKYAVQLMEKFGSFEYCREVLTQLDQEAREEIEALGSNSYLLGVLDELNICAIQEEACS